jgi:hypothetical protein
VTLEQALEIVKDHIRIGKGMELTNGVPEALEIVVVAFEVQTRENKRLKETVEELEEKNLIALKSLGLAVQSDAATYCVFNGIEKDLWPDYCKDPAKTERAVCVNCWMEYYKAKAGDSNG